jgi:glycosyltransferase involved in cell wall biosynthesis
VLEANSANKFYDYLSSGLPVVINYQGWQAGYLDRYRCGLSSKMGDLDALLANVLHLADTPALRLEMGQNGRRLAEDCFDRVQIARGLMQLFETVLSPR